MAYNASVASPEELFITCIRCQTGKQSIARWLTAVVHCTCLYYTCSARYLGVQLALRALVAVTPPLRFCGRCLNWGPSIVIVYYAN